MAQNDAVAQLNNVGIGMGMMTGVGGTLGQQVGSMAASAMQGAAGSVCTSCGHHLQPGAVFCEKCGTKVVSEARCSNCGVVVSEDAVFCPKCGTKRG